VKVLVIPTEVVPVEDTKPILEVKVPTEIELENVAIGTKSQAYGRFISSDG
jgi:hypothetical protein